MENIEKQKQQENAEIHFFFSLKRDKSKEEIIELANLKLVELKKLVSSYLKELDKPERDFALRCVLKVRHFYRHLIYLANTQM